MSLILWNTLFQHVNPSVFRYFSTCKILSNHYEILNLSRNCSAKEIKDSFIKLSKENHPDVNKNKDAHKRFLQINEAYNILSKTESRRFYDLTLTPPEFHHRNTIRVPYREQFGSNPWRDPSFYVNRNKGDDKEYENKPYYGIKGVERLSNLTVVIFCLTLATLVVGLQILAVRNSFTFKRDDLIKRSIAAEESLRQARETATLNGNEKQLELLKRRIVQINNETKYKDKT